VLPREFVEKRFVINDERADGVFGVCADDHRNGIEYRALHVVLSLFHIFRAIDQKSRALRQQRTGESRFRRERDASTSPSLGSDLA